MVREGKHSPGEISRESQQREEGVVPNGLSLPNPEQNFQNKGEEVKGQAKKSFEKQKRER